MKIISALTEDDFSAKACDLVAEVIKNSLNPLIVLPTGVTPLPVYKEWVKRFRNGQKELGGFTYLQLDEYANMPQNDVRLFQNWLDREILFPLGVQNRITFQSDAPNPSVEIERITSIIQNISYIDLAIVGIGMNGHVGFNEPGTSFDKECYHVSLDPITIEENKKYWDSSSVAPTKAYTLGVKALCKAKKTLLLVTSPKKNSILRNFLEGPVSTNVPISYLHQMDDVTILEYDAL